MPEAHGRWIATPHIPPDHRGPVDRPASRFPDPACAPSIIALLERAAAAGPERIAFEDESGALTYDAFRRAVLRLAAEIESRPASGPVAILLPASSRYAVAVFACLAAGRICLPLDTHYPSEHVVALAEAAGAGLMISDGGAGLPNIAGLDVAAAFEEAAAAAAAVGDALDLDAPAFILATSGSSGEPKLLVHSQRTMLHLVRTGNDAVHVTPDDRTLSVCSPSSLSGILSLLAFPLAGGATQMFEIKSAGFSGLIETLATRPVTMLRAAPSLLRALCQHADAAGPPLSGLRIVHAFGEPLLKADVDLLRQRLPASCRIRTTYGSTEASGMNWFAGEPDDYDPVRVATGILAPDTRAMIVDESGRACSFGEAGELVIASRYNALGEWIGGRLVPGRLEPDPADPAARIFRTGDVARCFEDGVFVVLGRKDRMVKINGQRVEPALVEASLRRIDGVRDAEVATLDLAGKTRLVAFLVPDAAAAGESFIDDVRRRLARGLPAFMLPSRIVRLEAIPRLPGGKADHFALSKLARAR